MEANANGSASPKRDACAVVLGGATAGYGIVQELHAHGVGPIVLVDAIARPSSRSRKLREFVRAPSTAEGLRDALRALHARYDYLVLFPTLDEHLEHLEACYDDLAPFCHLPFNRANLRVCLDKIHQYEACERLGVPYPRTRFLRKPEDLDGIGDLPCPLLLKPQEKTDSLIQPTLLERPEDLARHRATLAGRLRQGIQYLASEFVPGDGSNVHAYVGLRTADGRILNEWIGKKLSQYPNEFGVFASASNQCPEEVRALGRTLLDGMDLHGIAEPEFKYDARDGRFKLMEVNLRSMAWVHVGCLSGVPLHYCQFLHATGQEVPRYVQDHSRDVHLIQLRSELINLLHRDGYGPTFRSVFVDADRRVLTYFDLRDPVPFLLVLWATLKIVAAELGGRWLGRGRTSRGRPEAA